MEPLCLHAYVRPATIESFKKLNIVGAWADDNKSARHSLSPGVRHVLFWYSKSIVTISGRRNAA